jgi:hypothetical protein
MKPAPAISTLADEGRGRQFAHQALGDLARIGLQLACQLHRQVAGEIAMAGLLGTFEQDLGEALGGGHAGQRSAQQAGKVLAGVEGVCRICAGCGHVGNTRSFRWAVNYTCPLAAAASGMTGAGPGLFHHPHLRTSIPCASSACFALPVSPIATASTA